MSDIAGEQAREPLRLGDPAPWGEPTCQFGLTAPMCSKPATRHFIWLTDNATSAACDEHAAYIHSRDTSATPFDEHTHGGDCGMPGTMWQFPYEDQDEGYCFFLAPDDASAVAAEHEPVTVGASPIAESLFRSAEATDE